MGFEIECGSCGKRFAVEQDGGIVECPHCQTHLQLPERPDDPSDVPVAPESSIVKSGSIESPGNGSEQQAGSSVISKLAGAGLPEAADSGALSDEDSVFPGLPDAAAVSDVNMPSIDTGHGEQPATSDSTVAISDSPRDSEAEPDDAFPFPNTVGEDAPNPDNPTVLDDSLQEDLKQFVPQFETVAAPKPEEKAGPSPASKPSKATPAKKPAARESPRQDGVSRMLFFTVCGYASAVTIALIYLLITRGAMHPIERLPDVVPDPKGYLVPESTAMPPGHTLKIGDTQRFGNLKITPVKVTRGPAKMIFGDSPKPVETQPVLKLHLKIRNVSRDQSFRPFGRRLLMMRGTSDTRTKEGANIFVCRVEDKRQDGHLVYVLPLEGYRLRNQHVDRVLDPGDEYVTYIASNDEGLEMLTGDLLWRVHVRKGYNPKSKNGVTTIFEVTFHSDDVQAEGADG